MTVIPERPDLGETPQKRIEKNDSNIKMLASEMMNIVHNAVNGKTTIDDFYNLFVPMELEDFKASDNELALKVRIVFDKYIKDETLNPLFRDAYRQFQVLLMREHQAQPLRARFKKWLS